MSIRAALYRGEKKFTLEEKPVIPPAAGEVQLDVGYCGICGTDLHIYLGHMDQRVGFERTIGHEMSGVIAALGDGVTGLSIGQKVVVRPLVACGDCPACHDDHDHICHNLQFIGIDSDGAFQEKWNVPASTIHLLPDGVELSHAALIEPLAVACHDVERGGVSDGDNVLVIGGGPIGLLVALVARRAGGRVLVSEINESRLAYAASLGFETFNPNDTDVAQRCAELTGGRGADVVFEVSGSQAGVDLMTAAAGTRARLVMVAIHASRPVVDLFQFFWRELQLFGARVYRPEDYDNAMALLSAGLIDADSFITDIQPLGDIQAAFDSLAGNPKAIKSMIRISENL